MSFLPDINTKKRQSIETPAPQQNIKLPSIKSNIDDLIGKINTLKIEDDSTSKEQQLVLRIFNEYDDSEFHTMFYADEDSMKDILRLFSKKGIYLDTMTTRELSEIKNKIDKTESPWKWNFIMQLISCKVSPKDCYVSPETVPAKKMRYEAGKRNKRTRRKFKKKRRNNTRKNK